MRSILLIVILFIAPITSLSQKRKLEISNYRDWAFTYDNLKISNNGRYATTGDTAITIHDLILRKKILEVKGRNPIFTNDSKHFILTMSNGDILIFSLKTLTKTYITDVDNIIVPEYGISNRLIYKNVNNGVTAYSLEKSTSDTFNGVSEIVVSNRGTFLLMKTSDGIADNLIIKSYVSNYTDSLKIDGQLSEFTIDKNEHNIAFITNKPNDVQHNRAFIRGLTTQPKSVEVKFGNNTTDDSSRISVSDIRFINNGTQLFYRLQHKKKGIINAKDYENVEVWKYTDTKLNPAANIESQSSEYQFALYNIHTLKEVILPNGNELPLININDSKGYLLYPKRDDSLRFSDYPDEFGLKLIDTKNGIVKPIQKDGAVFRHLGDNTISPDGKLLILYDNNSSTYWVYNITKDLFLNISSTIRNLDKRNADVYKINRLDPWGIGGWSLNADRVYVYDEYDIWELDPMGVRQPICITQNLGKKRNTIFRFCDKIGDDEESTIVSSFNKTNKQNGIFILDRKKNNFKKLYESDELTYFPIGFGYIQGFSPTGYKPIKALDKKTYLVVKMKVNEFPNVYTTQDFQNYERLTQDTPQKQYNWLTSELLTWKRPDGKLGEGLLYKPEDFDSTRTYPVIFHFYERMSHLLNFFHKPDYSNGDINIPYYVSNGYLVFCVDVSYKDGNTCQNAYESVQYAADHIAKIPWVDSTRFGLQGHSFGGYEVNCIITKSNRFAAACSASGLSDIVYWYGSLHYGNKTGHHHTETGQLRVGATLWDDPMRYVNNSPIFFTNKINTPLLLMSNRADGDVDWMQGIEMYTSLRRQKKPVWLLQYTNGGHVVTDRDAEDFSIKMKQYFDHYLYKKDIPDWMKP